MYTYYVARLSLFKGNSKFIAIIRLDTGHSTFKVAFAEEDKTYNSLKVPYFEYLKRIKL